MEELCWFLFICTLCLGIQTTLQCGGGKPPDNSAMIAEQQEARRQELQLWCYDNCVTEWSPWAPCDALCGRGTMSRRRQLANSAWCDKLGDFTCPLSTSQTAGCNSGCPYGGLANKAKCVGCPSSRTGTCCETEIFCDYPKRPQGGRVTGQWPAKPGARAEFTCNTGYNLLGIHSATCKPDTSWSHPTPQCSAITCAQPQTNPNAEVLNPKPGYAFGEEIVYRCEDGYTMNGKQSRTCQRSIHGNGTWTGINVRCAAVKCPIPEIPKNGRITSQGRSFQFKDIVRFDCDTGYKLIGSDALQCLASGSWFGHQPTCEEITCDPPFTPRHGSVRIRKSGPKSFAHFSCDDGYRLQPEVTILSCNGTWNGTEPNCVAASCGDPGKPTHGYRDGGVFTYGNKVTFHCERGYEMKGGSEVIDCQSNALWSGSMPKCEACPMNFYMKGDKCEACPEYSLTTSNASTNLVQCLCDQEHGFIGSPGGPCEEVLCTDLAAPDNGVKPDCGTKVGESCSFSCNTGYIIERGSSRRTCQSTGEWDGTQTFCVPCKLNTYKSGERTCSPCPVHSHTTLPGQMKTGCICDDGYVGPPGGDCLDFNECVVNIGKGPCSDTCENMEGSYKCRCSIPGYKIDPRNDLTCVAEKQCRNLTRDEAPENGGVVCHWYYEENSQHCTTKCNPGYELPTRTNDYETCGPATGYTWSYQVVNVTASLAPCIEEFFPDFRLEAESAYFAAACDDLTEDQKDEAKQEFATRLNEKGVCAKRDTQICNIKDMAIICGRTTRRRRRRGVDYTLHSVDFAYNVSALKFEDKSVDCHGKICPMLRIPARYCETYCGKAYKRYLQAAVEYAKRQLTSIHADKNRLRELAFTTSGTLFEPEEEGFHGGPVITECPTGMMPVEGQCVPCKAGSYLDEELNECVKCSANTYQSMDKQNKCIPCKVGFGVGYTTYGNASITCTLCQTGTWGEECKNRCNCANGNCSPYTGECICPSGWQGERCEIDIDSCVEGACYPGVTCVDQPPPGTGFSCGACPDGYQGNGYDCARVISKRSVGMMASIEL